MRADALAEALAETPGPTIVCAQAGNVNSGAFDPLAGIAGACREHGAWLHVDGAFGLWAAASPALRHHVAGIGLAQSWAVDGHKWLNVPYDCGIVMVADAEAQQKAMTISGSYLVKSDVAALDATNWVPEASRRLRGFAVYAALRSLGREGVAALVERCCALARRLADRLGAEPGIEILNDVVINQVLVRFGDRRKSAAADALTLRVIDAIQREGTCWAGGTVWHGMAAMRVSVSNWSTGEADIDRSADAILACYREAGE
jgi:glutamate/tyrosine decarboxylase-like PLP-dependent enzyme